MPKTINIPLDEAINVHGRIIDALTYREPRMEDVLGVGPPYTIHTDAEGKPFLVYDEAAIRHYARVCLVDADPLIVETEVGLAATMKVRDAVVGFFLDAAAGAGGSRTSRTPSSSTSGGSPTPSAA